MRLIDADIAMNMISDEMITDAKALDIFRALGDADKVETLNMACARHVLMIKQLPVVDAEPVRHGHWKGKPIAGYSTVRCSECGDVFMENSGKWNFCPNCGAYMGGWKNETD